MTEYSIESGEPLSPVDEANYAPGATPLPIILANDAPTATGQIEQFDNLRIDCLTPSLTNPRKTFDPLKLTELAESIKTSGLHQPILVRPLPGSRLQDTFDIHATSGLKVRPTHEIVAGERRYRACKLAGVATIPALIRPLTDHQVLEVQIIENLQRDDLSDLEEAEGYEHLCQATGISKEDVGAKIGKSRAYVYARLKLLDLSADCKHALRTSAVDFSRALMIARIPDTALQQKALLEATRQDYKGDVISLRELQTWLQKNVMLRLEDAPFDIANTQLCPAAGSCKTCPTRTGANPDLFSDVASADLCTNPPCFQAKEAAHRAQIVAQAEAKGMRVIDGKEAQELFKSNVPMGGYTRLDQRRTDVDATNSPSLRKLLGTELPSLMPVLIEHPRTKELIEAVPTAESEAMLITRGLLKQTRAAETNEREVARLRDSLDERIKDKSRRAIFAALVKNVHAQQGVDGLVSADLIRAWLIANTYDIDSDDMLLALNMTDSEVIDDDSLRLRIQTLSTSGLWKALTIIFILNDHPDCYLGRRSDETPAFNALAATTGTDIGAIVHSTRAEVKADLTQKIKALKAEATSSQTAPVEPLSDVAFSKGDGGNPPKPKKTKTTAAQAQAAIAAAMQATDPQPDTNTGDAVASQGPVAASGFALSVGTRVVVTAGCTLRLPLQKYSGKEGTITAKMGDRSWDVTFKGRTGGIASFDSSEIAVVAGGRGQA